MVRVHFYINSKKSICGSSISPKYRITSDVVRVTCPECLKKLGYEDVSDRIKLSTDFLKVLSEYFDISNYESEIDCQIKILDKLVNK